MTGVYILTRRSQRFAANEKGFLLAFFSPEVKIKYSLGASSLFVYVSAHERTYIDLPNALMQIERGRPASPNGV